eukprot:7288910-Ditylum_brightwellii.AAC.1
MAKVTLNTLSQSSKEEDVVGENQNNAEHDMLEQNKSDEQQITTEGKNGKEDGMKMVEEK